MRLNTTKKPFKLQQNIIMLLVTAVLLGLFSLINPNLLKLNTLAEMVKRSAPYAVLGLGVTFVIATGGIDLSLGTVCYASAVIAGKLWKMNLIPFWATIPLMLVIGTLCGLANGLMVAKLKIPAFIATLGTMMVARGLSALLANVPSIDYPGSGWYKDVFSRYMLYPAGGGKPIQIPVGLFWIIGLMLLCMYLMYKNKTGRYILAIGSNEEATRLSGINTDKYKIFAYTFAGLFCGIAAIFYSASFPTIQCAGGSGMELDAIAGVYIGGTSSAGGVASVSGSVIGAFLLEVIRSGLNMVLTRLNIKLNSEYVTFVLTGIIVVVAILMDIIKTNNQNKLKIEKIDSAKKKEPAAQDAPQA
jgi:ribose transport system permease protein